MEASNLPPAEVIFSDCPTAMDHSNVKSSEPEEQEDIYRGEPPILPTSPPIARPPSVSSTSSSSSSRSGLGLRRGPLSAVLERAINRWARSSSGSSTSSSTTSLASSSSSVHTRQPRRRRRRSSNATTHDAHLDVIRARRRAQEESRMLPRELVLFLPASLAPRATKAQLFSESSTLLQNEQGRMFRTTSLPLILVQLEAAIRRAGKLQRSRQPRTQRLANGLPLNLHDYMIPESAVSRGLFGKTSKGKARDDFRVPRKYARLDVEQSRKQGAWWLDVSSPTWSDMREIGKVLHLHPLTLEDILYQDPREKLELFPRLGYYFIVFRALTSGHTKSTQTDGHHIPFIEKDVTGATNVYIIVFREGICTFHFEDIADHVERMRNKVLQLEETVHTSSDWIAHGILDSIVDDFFPLLNLVEREIKDLDDVVLSLDSQTAKKADIKTSFDPAGGKLEPSLTETKKKTSSESTASDERLFQEHPDRTSFISWLRSAVDRIMAIPIHLYTNWTARWSRRNPQPPTPISPLMRMASTRRLVTSLTRLLGTKSEVVSQIQKRLIGGLTTGSNVGVSERVEVGIYLGDIQDHILTLQQSLAHYERMLSHSHPAYISQLRVSLSQAKAGMDTALLRLSLISVSVVAMQLLIGLFSVNIKIPQNNRLDAQAPYNVFCAIVAGAVLVGAGMVSLVRYWWLHAKRKYARQSKF